MRRIGANRIVMPDGEVRRNHVVEYDDEGRIVAVVPLTEETAMTEWKTGEICLAPS